MKFFLFISILVLLSSCTTGIDFKNVNYDNLLHDDNSKVWVVNKVKINGAVISSNNYLDKDILIFHENGICDLVAFKDLSSGKSRKGQYTIDSDKKIMSITFPNEYWSYNMSDLSEDSITLNPTKKSGSQFGFQLKPFMQL